MVPDKQQILCKCAVVSVTIVSVMARINEKIKMFNRKKKEQRHLWVTTIILKVKIKIQN